MVANDYKGAAGGIVCACFMVVWGGGTGAHCSSAGPSAAVAKHRGNCSPSLSWLLCGFAANESRLSGRLSAHVHPFHICPTAPCPPSTGALEEVEWLRAKLESLETALLAGSLDSGLLAALDGGGVVGGAAEVLEAARAAVLGAGGLGLQMGSPSSAAPAGMEALTGQLAAGMARSGAAEEMGEEMAVVGSGGCAPQEQPEEDGLEELQAQRAASKLPLIDRYLIANPSELQEAAVGPAAQAQPLDSSSGGALGSSPYYAAGEEQSLASEAAGAAEVAAEVGAAVDELESSVVAAGDEQPAAEDPSALRSVPLAGCTATVVLVGPCAAGAKAAALPAEMDVVGCPAEA